MKSLKLSIVILLIAIFPFAALAHLEGEALLDNSYRVEVGHYPVDVLYEKETVNFSISMETEAGDRILNSNTWIRVSKGDEILFSSADFTTTDGTVDFDFVFPDAGEYEMMIRVTDIDKDDDATVQWPATIVENPSLHVEELESKPRENVFNLSVLTFILGGIIGVLMARYRPQNSNGVKKSN